MIILDVEASGLGSESYPIEIAWAHRFDPTRYDSFLIKPPENWTYWDAYAELQIHGISRDVLASEGILVEEAVARLDESLSGETVYSDFVPVDRPWVVRLYQQLGREPSFTFRPLQSLLPPDKVGDYSRDYGTTPTEHRALADVRKMIRTLNFYAPE